MSSLLTFGISTQASIPTVSEILFRGLVYYPVTSSTGKVWLDRNLGATRVATAYNDSSAYGHLFQWGRYWDGHEVRTSSTTTTNATTAVPNAGNVWDGLFIREGSSPYDWLTPQNHNLWQGVDGTNNPCPAGYRIPTKTELDAERASWSSNNQAGAFGSPLKLPASGYRDGSSGAVGTLGYYWSSTDAFSRYAWYLFINTAGANVNFYRRAGGYAVRCICDAC